MKTMNRSLLIATLLAGVSLIAIARAADEPLLSPRAQATEIKRVTGVNRDVDLAHAPTLVASPRSLAIRHPVVAGNAKSDADLAHAPGPFFSPKHLEVFGAKLEKFEIAPLK